MCLHRPTTSKKIFNGKQSRVFFKVYYTTRSTGRTMYSPYKYRATKIDRNRFIRSDRLIKPLANYEKRDREVDHGIHVCLKWTDADQIRQFEFDAANKAERYRHVAKDIEVIG